VLVGVDGCWWMLMDVDGCLFWNRTGSGKREREWEQEGKREYKHFLSFFHRILNHPVQCRVLPLYEINTNSQGTELMAGLSIKKSWVFVTSFIT
jgi:hypothetical protein